MSRSRAWPLLVPTWVVLGIFFLAPLGIMFGVSLRERGAGGRNRPIEDVGRYVAEGKFLDNYRESLDPGYAGVYWRSLWIAVATTVLCLVLGYPAAYYVAAVAPARWKNLLLAGAVLPFWTSFLVRTFAWKLILGDYGLLNTAREWAGLGRTQWLDTPAAVLIGLVYGELPFMILPLYASIEKMDRALLEAAADLGAGPVGRFFRVVVPQTMPGIVAGVVLVFIPAAGQFVVSDMLGGAKSPLVGNIIQENYYAFRQVKSAVAFELTAFVMALLAAYGIYVRRRGSAEAAL